MLSLWRISQDVNNGYDTYDSAVVVAETSEEARHVHPGEPSDAGRWWESKEWYGPISVWAHPDAVKAIYLGAAEVDFRKGEVIVASFNAE